MQDFDVRAFDRWCRDVGPVLADFRAACIHRNRRKAGKELGKEGCNVGKAVTKLEELLKEDLGGGSLIDRGEPRKVYPTEAGEAVLQYCEELYALRSRLLDRLKYLQHGSEIRVATTNYAWIAYGNALEAAYRKRRPDGVVNFGDQFYSQDRVWEEIERDVLEGRADIGVYSFPPSRANQVSPDLAVLNWVEEEFVLVLSGPAANNVKAETISLRDLPSLPRVVHYSRSLGFDRTDTIEDYLRREDVLKRYPGDWLLGVNTISEIQNTLLHKDGISFLPWPAVECEHRKGTLRAYRLNHPMRPRTIRIICRLHTSRRAVADFVQAAATLEVKRSFPH
jgi:DNA-binding transcriptional LysR family regulator